MDKSIKTSMTKEEIEEVIFQNPKSLDINKDVYEFMMEFEPNSFLDQHEKTVKKNMEDLMKFMRK